MTQAGPPRSSGAEAGILHSSRLLLPATIRVVDVEKREIEVCATSEALDSFGTIFGYEASKDAFTRWIGNVREMHERNAVGSSVALHCDDDARKIYVRIRISAGAPDTWEKLKDGTLRGASIGAANVVWTRQNRGGKLVPVATSYDLNELSLVDNPSNADALGFTFVRDGSIPDGLLEPLDWATPAMPATPAISVTQASDARSADAAPATPASISASDLEPMTPAGAPQRYDDIATQIALRRLQANLAEMNGIAQSAQPAVVMPTTTQLRRDVLDPRPSGVPALAHPSGVPASGVWVPASGVWAPGLTERSARLAAAGMPMPLPAAAPSATSATSAPSATSATAARDRDGNVTGPNAKFDDDGDHDAMSDDSAPLDRGDPTDTQAATAGMSHDRAALSHDAHDHTHTGGYDDSHDHSGAHQHEDGSAHTHQHYHGHSHHDTHAQTYGYEVSDSADRVSAEQRAMGGVDAHNHPHGHFHNHAHAYRIADGVVIDARCVTADQVRTREYVSAVAWRVARGVEGRGLTADQFRIAAGVEQRLELEAAGRAQGAFSRNPYGAADIGAPAEAQRDPDESAEDISKGRIRQLDRDGQPSANPATLASVSNTPAPGGVHDINELPDGFAELTDHKAETRNAQPAVIRVSGIAANVEREIARIERERAAERVALAQRESRLTARIAALEAQPQPGGPVFNGMAGPVEKRDALTPGASGASSSSTAAERIAALQAVAARVTDPQAQVEIATQIMLIQQEERGASVEQMAMPQAGRRIPTPRQAW